MLQIYPEITISSNWTSSDIIYMHANCKWAIKHVEDLYNGGTQRDVKATKLIEPYTFLTVSKISSD